MKQITAIGGGGFRNEKSNLKIEKYLLAQIKKEHPKICLLPLLCCLGTNPKNAAKFRPFLKLLPFPVSKPILGIYLPTMFSISFTVTGTRFLPSKRHPFGVINMASSMRMPPKFW